MRDVIMHGWTRRGGLVLAEMPSRAGYAPGALAAASCSRLPRPHVSFLYGPGQIRHQCARNTLRMSTQSTHSFQATGERLLDRARVCVAESRALMRSAGHRLGGSADRPIATTDLQAGSRRLLNDMARRCNVPNPDLCNSEVPQARDAVGASVQRYARHKTDSRMNASSGKNGGGRLEAARRITGGAVGGPPPA